MYALNMDYGGNFVTLLVDEKPMEFTRGWRNYQAECSNRFRASEINFRTFWTSSFIYIGMIDYKVSLWRWQVPFLLPFQPALSLSHPSLRYLFRLRNSPDPMTIEVMLKDIITHMIVQVSAPLSYATNLIPSRTTHPTRAPAKEVSND